MNYACGEILGLQAPKLDTFCAIIRTFYDLHNADIDFARGKPIIFKAKFYWEGPPEAKILRICALSMAKMFHIQDSLLCCVLNMITLATIDCMIMIWPWTDSTLTIHPKPNIYLTTFGTITISIGHRTPKYDSKQFRNKVDNLHGLYIVRWIHRCGSTI